MVGLISKSTGLDSRRAQRAAPSRFKRKARWAEPINIPPSLEGAIEKGEKSSRVPSKLDSRIVRPFVRAIDINAMTQRVEIGNRISPHPSTTVSRVISLSRIPSLMSLFLDLERFLIPMSPDRSSLGSMGLEMTVMVQCEFSGWIRGKEPSRINILFSLPSTQNWILYQSQIR